MTNNEKSLPEPSAGGLGLLLAALGMGALMGEQVAEDLAALAARTNRVRPEEIVLRAAELLVRGVGGALEETAGPLAASSELRREIEGAAEELRDALRRLARAQALCERPEQEKGEGG
jgi:hypothetical protein